MKDKPRGWYSEDHDVPLHPTMTVHEQDRDEALPRIVLPDGRELVARRPLGFRVR